MKFKADFSFPHPVLGMSNVPKPDLWKIESEIEMNEDEYILRILLEHDNRGLDILIDSESAEYVCEVSCSDTFYRKLFRSSNPIITFAIGRKEVKGRIDILCYAITTKEVPGYKNDAWGEGYSIFTFNFEEGDILAYFGNFNFDADIRYDKVKAVSSFMEVEEGASLQTPNIVLESSKIIIQLPKDQYSIFANSTISQDTQYASIFHASIVYNALLVALYNIQENEDYAWAKTINHRMKEEPELQKFSLSDKSNIPSIATELLGNPTKRLFDTLYSLKTDYNNID